MIAILDGIQSKKSADKYYQLYDENFENRKEIEEKFSDTINLIGNLFGDTLKESNFRTVPNFYGLFIALYHVNYGIPNLNADVKK